MVSHRCVKLTGYFTRDYVANVHDCFRVRVVASDAHLMPDAVFAYMMLPLQPGQASPRALFDHVCSPVDLADFPAGAPDAGAIPAWFRLPWVEFDDYTREQALENYHKILKDVAALAASLDNAEVMVAMPPVWIGYRPGSDGSSVGSSDGSLT